MLSVLNMPNPAEEILAALLEEFAGLISVHIEVFLKGRVHDGEEGIWPLIWSLYLEERVLMGMG
jgi:hypothetical protein